jgi:DNA-binding response OmpR family regulator
MPTAGAQASRVDRSQAGRTVLVVDDQLDMLARYAMTLDRAGFRVRICPGAAEAVRVAAEDPPSLIVVGLERPGADGWTGLQQLAAESATAAVAILAANRHRTQLRPTDM